MTRLSVTRREITEATGELYGQSGRSDKRQILDEFTQLTGYHRKHAIRVLHCHPRPSPGPSATMTMRCAALITLWEAGDRICGKRLKAITSLPDR